MCANVLSLSLLVVSRHAYNTAGFPTPEPYPLAQVAGAVEDVTEAVSSSGSQWVLKASEADRGDGVFFLDGARPRPEVEALVAAALGSSPQQQLWVIQRYVQRPLLLRGRKFHLRVMVLAVGDLAVYVHRNAVALFASDDFSAEDFSDKCGHRARGIAAAADGARN